MAFVKIVKSAMGARHSSYEIRMGSQLQSARQAHRNIYFAITRAVIEEVGWEVLTSPESTRNYCPIHIMEGTGSDAGFLLLEYAEDNKGYSLGTTKEKMHTFSMGLAVSRVKHYVLNELPVDPHQVEFTVDAKDHTILIQCPDWLRYNPLTAPPEPEPEPPPPPQPVVVHARAEELARVIPPTLRGKRNAATAAVDALSFVEHDDDPKTDEMFKLNRQERRTLAKKVATTIGKR